MRLACGSIGPMPWQSYSLCQARWVPRASCQWSHTSIANLFVASSAYRTLGLISYTQLVANLSHCFAILQNRIHHQLIFRALSSTPTGSHCLTTSRETQNTRMHLTTGCLAGEPASSVNGSTYTLSNLNFLLAPRKTVNRCSWSTWREARAMISQT